jgi:hypothetical protein
MSTLQQGFVGALATLPHEEALDRLVEAWRREPDAVLAEAAVRLDRLTQRAAASGPIAARSAHWRALLEDGSPRALGEAIAAFPFGTIDESLAQLEALDRTLVSANASRGCSSTRRSARRRRAPSGGERSPPSPRRATAAPRRSSAIVARWWSASSPRP